MIKTIGSKERAIITIGLKENKVDSQVVAKALGAECVAYIGLNPHNLPLPKPVQERLAKNLGTDNNETQAELVAIEVS